MATVGDAFRHWVGTTRERIEQMPVSPELERIGRVVQAADGVARVEGLSHARLDERLEIVGGGQALAVDLARDSIGCVLLGAAAQIAAGSLVRGTGDVLRVPVGDGLLGRVVDALGSPLDGGSAVVAESSAPIEGPAPPIVDRALVERPLATGVLVVDAAIPIGRGQRELIIGDRGTGKTALALDTMINQRSSDLICVYAAIGQKASSVAAVIDAVRRYGAPERCLFVVGAADAAPGLQWITPYCACTMAEHFTAQGRDVLLVLDDLTKHAAVYREISLLLRRPPGREAYPGDIFYIHSRLLERAAKLSEERGGGSLTALPIAETQAGNLSAYIPTNLISITDGQIYLDPRLFHENQKPAVDVGRSVSRVGGKAQAAALKALAESLRLEYAQFLELEVFTRFGTLVDERTRRIIEHGRRIRAVLTQPQFAPLTLAEEVAILLALTEGVLDDVALECIDGLRAKLRGWLAERCPEALVVDERAPVLSGPLRAKLREALKDLAATVASSAARAGAGKSSGAPGTAPAEPASGPPGAAPSA
jgi:F-type H+/Na+-transporting ATPase subunit alpha